VGSVVQVVLGFSDGGTRIGYRDWMESFLGGRYQLDDLQLCDSMIWIEGVGVVPDNLAMHDSTSFVVFREIASLKWII